MALEAAKVDVLERLGSVCERRGLVPLAGRLDAIARLVGRDLAECEAELDGAPRGERHGPGSLVTRSAEHLLARGGKRLRPVCVLLAARAGDGGGVAARELAIAAELVHNATLLHDDVVDLGDVRRGVATARVLYGNAASIFAGDWLLVAALRRVSAVSVAGATDRLLLAVEEMIAAEAEQLEQRGRIEADRARYFRVARGKTAALFRWALWAGGRAGRLDERACDGLERFGGHLGIAFQAVDDLLDLAGDPERTGKALFADLREGKVTFPITVALERAPSLQPTLERLCAGTPLDEREERDLGQEVRRAVEAAGAAEACRALARDEVERAIAALEGVPPSEARDALAGVAIANVARER